MGIRSWYKTKNRLTCSALLDPVTVFIQFDVDDNIQPLAVERQKFCYREMWN